MQVWDVHADSEARSASVSVAGAGLGFDLGSRPDLALAIGHRCRCGRDVFQGFNLNG